MRHDITLLAERRHHTCMPNKRLRQRGLHHPGLSPQGLYQLLRHCSHTRTRIHEDLAAEDAPRTTRRPAACCISASKCGSVSTVSTLVSPDPSGCKTETRAYEVVLQSPSHCCDAGAGSCTGTNGRTGAAFCGPALWEIWCYTDSVRPVSTGATFSRGRRMYT